jgi:hypothetical protein
MDRSKLVAIATGIISIALALIYLLIVQFLDFRGEMIPAPITGEMLTSPPLQLPVHRL